ncbi:MAG: AraC family transcriptional regulator [Actinotalea sp.]|nr:AraC family transcriptional regulator [Actinotalea sp.]
MWPTGAVDGAATRYRGSAEDDADHARCEGGGARLTVAVTADDDGEAGHEGRQREHEDQQGQDVDDVHGRKALPIDTPPLVAGSPPSVDFRPSLCETRQVLRSVAVIVLPGVAPFELGVACEIFGVDRRDTGGPAFDFTVCAETPGPVPTKIGMDIVVHHDLQAAREADLVVMPAYGDDRPVPESVLQVLRGAEARGAWVMSVCSGAFALGRAGLLDGRRCTTHWMYTDKLAADFPAAQVDPAVLYVEDDGVVTSAGTAAGIDAGLHIVRSELGATAAAAIARRMVVPPHRDGGQAQYIDRPIPCGDGELAPVLNWIMEHLDEVITVPALARRARMSERTFARRFRAETGTTPAGWTSRQRLLRAQELLQGSDLSVEEVARRSGFGASAALRHHFARSIGTSPQAYRRTFSTVGTLRTGLVVGSADRSAG